MQAVAHEKSSTNAASGLGPVGLYYFFSPDDQSALKDVAVLNKIFQEGRLGVVGIPVRGKDEEIIQFLNEAKPLFPVRRSEAEVRMIKPSETPDLYLAFPLEKKMLRFGTNHHGDRRLRKQSAISWPRNPEENPLGFARVRQIVSHRQFLWLVPPSIGLLLRSQPWR